jgi:MtfA peptidase
MFGFFKRHRRARLRRHAFPPQWLDIIQKWVPYYSLLSDEEQRTLQGHIQVFLEEKNFEGCRGFKITDRMRLAVAAQACLLLLDIDLDYFPRLRSILMYSDAFVTAHKGGDSAGVVSETGEIRTGESWDIGAVILAWDDVERDTRRFDGHNVVLHEFAHQIDQSDGTADGWPNHLDPSLDQRWAEVMGQEYARLIRSVERGQTTLIDGYGATKPAEFFAVVTEFFFERPRELRQFHPELYEMFRLFYHQDPAARFSRGST